MNNKKKILTIKTNAIKLRKNYQLPSELYSCIMYINDTTSIDKIEKLKNASNELMRVKGYYSSDEKNNKGNEEFRKLIGVE